uniref:Uncharacterized protein n=1 Tax=Oryza rufipogon TaxID=4529 RepID=A0A0E0MWJ3_ORYRU
MSGWVNLRKEFGRQCFTTVGFMKLAVGIVRVKLDSLCRGELNHSNVPYSRFWSCVIRVIPTPEV